MGGFFLFFFVLYSTLLHLQPLRFHCIPQVFDLEIKPQSASTVFRAFLPSANYSAEWSAQMWQRIAESNGCLEHFFWNLKCARQPLHYVAGFLTCTSNAASSNSKIMREMAILICSRLLWLTGWIAQPTEYISLHFFKCRKTLLGCNMAFIFDENERLCWALNHMLLIADCSS